MLCIWRLGFGISSLSKILTWRRRGRGKLRCAARCSRRSVASEARPWLATSARFAKVREESTLANLCERGGRVPLSGHGRCRDVTVLQAMFVSCTSSVAFCFGPVGQRRTRPLRRFVRKGTWSRLATWHRRPTKSSGTRCRKGLRNLIKSN